MKKNRVAAVFFALTLTTVSGCSADYGADASTIFILSNGKVVSTDVEEFQEESYSKSDLSDFIDQELANFCEENGKNAAKRKELEVKDDTATLSIQYENAEFFSEFVGEHLFSGTIAEALVAGYSFDTEFVEKTEDGTKQVAKSEVLDHSKYHVVIYDGNARIQIPNKVKYYSQGVVAVSDREFEIGSTGETPVAEPDSQVTETGTEDGAIVQTTEPNQGVAGAISDDEMLTGEEGSEIYFDFGSAADESKEETSSKPSEPVYIIYK